MSSRGRAVKPEKCAARHVFDGRTVQCGAGEGGEKGRDGWNWRWRCLLHSCSCARHATRTASNKHQRSHAGLPGKVYTFGRNKADQIVFNVTTRNPKKFNGRRMKNFHQKCDESSPSVKMEKNNVYKPRMYGEVREKAHFLLPQATLHLCGPSGSREENG